MEAHGSTKRGAPEGTPGRETDARSKLPSTAVVPRALAVEPVESGAKVEMSAATISALRSMMRDEIRHGMVEMEQRFTAKLSTAMGEIREELGAEKVARQQLAERFRHLEQQNMGEQGKHAPHNFEDEDVDKSVVVVGGFVEKSLADAEALVQEMMVGIKGYKDVDMIDVEPPLALARFDSPGEAMKFIRSQQKNATVQTNQLWASENREQKGLDAKLWAKSKSIWLNWGGLRQWITDCQLQEFQGGGPPQLQIDSGGAGWSDFGSGVVGGLHCECSSAWSHGGLPTGRGVGVPEDIAEQWNACYTDRWCNEWRCSCIKCSGVSCTDRIYFTACDNENFTKHSCRVTLSWFLYRAGGLWPRSDFYLRNLEVCCGGMLRFAKWWSIIFERRTFTSRSWHCCVG